MLTHEGAVLCWHRGLRTTGFNASAPESKRLELMVEKPLALLISASREQTRGQGRRRITCGLRNHLEWSGGGGGGLISVGSAVSVCFTEYVCARACVFGFLRRLIDTIS